MSAVLILIEFLSPECLPIVVKGASFIEGPSCGTVHLLVLVLSYWGYNVAVIQKKILIPDNFYFVFVVLCLVLCLFLFVAKAN